MRERLFSSLSLVRHMHVVVCKPNLLDAYVVGIEGDGVLSRKNVWKKRIFVRASPLSAFVQILPVANCHVHVSFPCSFVLPQVSATVRADIHT
jgi:hypothetical protein